MEEPSQSSDATLVFHPQLPDTRSQRYLVSAIRTPSNVIYQLLWYLARLSSSHVWSSLKISLRDTDYLYAVPLALSSWNKCSNLCRRTLLPLCHFSTRSYPISLFFSPSSLATTTIMMSGSERDEASRASTDELSIVYRRVYCSLRRGRKELRQYPSVNIERKKKKDEK